MREARDSSAEGDGQPEHHRETHPDYDSRINFDSFLKSKHNHAYLSDPSAATHLRIKHLERNFLVHYIDELNKDFSQATTFLTQLKVVSIEIQADGTVPSYLHFSCKRRCYVFNLFKIGSTSEFRDLLRQILSTQGIKKIVFDLSLFEILIHYLLPTPTVMRNMEGLQQLLGVTGAIQSLENFPLRLSSLCRRFFGKDSSS